MGREGVGGNSGGGVKSRVFSISSKNRPSPYV